MPSLEIMKFLFENSIRTDYHQKKQIPIQISYKSFLQGLIILAILVITYHIYSFGFTSGLRFDDVANLSQLSTVTDFKTAIFFASEGTAGPLGRPISLLSFALQASYWPNLSSEFIRWNVLIHLLNTALLALLTYKILCIYPRYSTTDAGWLTIFITTIWTAHPFLASTSLMTIQRMTTLSAFFILLGLLFYVYGRALSGIRPVKAYIYMSTGLIGGTILATLCKENGALLPLYALVLEAIIFKDIFQKNPKYFQIWKYFILIIPTIALFVYFALDWQNINARYISREFTLPERLATESIILWEYIRQIISPNPAFIGPYHDDFPIYNWSIQSYLALTSWIAVILSTFFIRVRIPVLFFGVAWFLSGHLLESSIINLELYFEHRNYLPSIGIISIVSIGLFEASKFVSNKFRWIVSIYPIIMVALLLQITTLWGDPLLAADMWQRNHPKSPRAAQNLSQKLSKLGYSSSAFNVIKEAAITIPKDSGLALQALQVGCSFYTKDEFNSKIRNLINITDRLEHSNAALDSLHKLVSIAINGECKDLTISDTESIAKSLLANPKFYSRKNSLAKIHMEISRIAMYQKNLDKTIIHMKQAFDIYPNQEILFTIVETLVSAGLYDEAQKEIRFATTKLPRHPIKRSTWLNLVDQLDKMIMAKKKTINQNAF